MKKAAFLLFTSIIFLTSCGEDKKKTNTTQNTTEEVKAFDDSDYVLSDAYPMGDVRRYGVFPDSTHSKGHPFTKKSRIETILDLSSNHEIEMTFPKGYYDSSLIIKGKNNLSLNFNDSEFGGIIQIIEQDSTQSSNITLKGNLTSYTGFFTRKSNGITIEDLNIKSDPSKSTFDMNSKGCQIFAGTKDVKINTLVIDDIGSDGAKYKYINSALSIEGWNNNPEGVKINKVHIKSSDRHGVYLTGREHEIGELIIDKFGVGSAKDMAPMQDAKKGEEKDFKALWVNKCYDSFIENVTINEKGSKGKYTAHFDSGKKEQPVKIGVLKILNDNLNIGILEEDKNGVIIEVQE